MTNASWRDDELRAFFSALRGGGIFSAGPDDDLSAAVRARLASGDDPEQLGAVLDLVEQSVRQQS